ncbi:MAG: TolC family protein [Acidobacteriia bacterium]|nr:TolC family protein [Terriglobia bacterium]
MPTSRITVVFALAVTLTGCAVRKYRPAPISPSASAASLRARTLNDEGLRKYLTEVLHPSPAQWPLQRWSLPELTLAAFYYNPNLQLARARMAEADAAVITAGARPNPVVGGSIGGSTSPDSPWLGALHFDLPLEIAGKRGHRVTRAQRLAEAARWDLASAAWTVRSRVRSALLQYVTVTQRLQALQQEERVRAEQVRLLEQRLTVGLIPQPEVDAARILHSQVLLALEQSQEQFATGKAALAAAVGVPVSALQDLALSWTDFDHPTRAESLPQSAIQDDVVLNRLDIRRALVDYAAAEADLQLEIAKQYPDINLGPGYNFEEAHHKFSLGFSVVLPVLNQNQGPIAQAEARREQAAARFLATQAAGISASEEALARYRASLKELDQARSLQQQSASLEQATQRALAAGESDRVALNGAQLQVAIAAGATLDALSRVHQAMGDLEDAVQRPLLPGDIQPLSSQSPELKPAPRK